MAPRKRTLKARHETIRAFTERAMTAADAQRCIPPIVYLPAALRAHRITITEDNLKVDVKPPTVIGNHVRIAEADPLGFLFALMQGQPIPKFVIIPNRKDAGNTIRVEYEVADITLRTEIAKWLGTRVTYRPASPNRPSGTPRTDEYNALIANASEDDGIQENPEAH